MKLSIGARVTLTVLLSGLLTAILSVTFHFLFGPQQWVLEPLNEFFESAGTWVALGVALLRSCAPGTSRRRTWSGSGQLEAQAQARTAEVAAIMDAMPALTFIARDPEARRMTSSRAVYELLRLPHSSNTSLNAPPS